MSPEEVRLLEQELNHRLTVVESDMGAMKTELLLLRTETLAQFKNISETLQILIRGESASCMRHDARIAALELSTAAFHAAVSEKANKDDLAIIATKADKELINEVIAQIKRNLSVVTWVGGVFVVAVIGAVIKHIVG